MVPRFTSLRHFIRFKKIFLSLYGPKRNDVNAHLSSYLSSPEAHLNQDLNYQIGLKKASDLKIEIAETEHQLNIRTLDS